MVGERRAAILGMIIDYYIRTGEPLGSKSLCEMLPYSISSATIRNEMAALTAMGYLEQRHTSGGRVPTKAAYRYYVDNLMDAKRLTSYEKQIIAERLSTNASDPERLLADAAKLLSEVTGCAAFYSTVKDPIDCVQGVELIPAGGGKVMLVMLTLGGKIKSSVCTLHCPCDEEFKAMFYGFAHEYFVGTPLEEIDLSFIQSAAPVLGLRVFDMLPLLSSLCSLCQEAANGSLVVYGETKLLSQTELEGSVFNLLMLLAGKEKLEKLLTRFACSNVKQSLVLGDENPLYELNNTAMALARFDYNNSQIATLGMIGSLRIDYKTILPRVDYIIKLTNNYLKEGGVRYE
ncbi:MAG: heat-inducible transcription repressor HrcA [Eubacterium sp.]|nr:heat-inducible transcription repressor HrcA [Eubacterium sp.]